MKTKNYMSAFSAKEIKRSLLSCLIFFLGITVSSCSSENGIIEQDKNIEAESCIGTTEFIASLNNISVNTKNENIEDEKAKVPIIVEVAIEYLAKNNISYTDFCNDKDDPRIAIIAMGLAEYDQISSTQTKTSIGGCVLEAIGVKDLGNAGVKAAAKQIGKAVLKKAVPYVGWGLFAVDMVMCLAD